jgi:hypothetical protein
VREVEGCRSDRTGGVRREPRFAAGRRGRTIYCVATFALLAASAATQMSGTRLPHFGLRWLGFRLQERGQAHDKAGRAESALQAVFLHESELHGSKPAAGNTLHGRDLAALRLDGQHHAGVHRHAIEQDGARTTRRPITHFLGTGEPGVLPDGLQEGDAGLEREHALLAVDRECDGNGLRSAQFLRIRLGQFGRDSVGAERRRRDCRRAEAAQKLAA